MENLKRIISKEYSPTIIGTRVHIREHQLTEAQIEQIRMMYPCTNTEMLAQEMGIHRVTVRRYAKRMGISKDKEYMRLMNKEKGRRRRAVQIEIQKIKPRRWTSQFVKGHTVRENMTEEQILAYNQKISESKKALYRKERRRVEFGLPQRTRMKVGKQNPYKLKLKYRLKAKGYIIDEEQGIAYYNEHTTRATTCEKRGNPWFIFKRYETDEKQN